jgi:hypothetical protein
MTTIHSPVSVGAPDPELKNSPIMEEMDEEYPFMGQEYEDLPACYFNNVSYAVGTYVCSGSGELLRCENGVWVCEGSCDPDNP